MALEDITRRIVYTCDGSTTSFSFPFLIFEDTDIAVYRKLTESTEEEISSGLYTVTVSTTTAPGGTVTFTEAPDDGDVIAIVSNIPATQPMTLTNYGGFNPENLNDSADRAVALIQQVKEATARTVALPATSSMTASELLDEIFEARGDAEADATAAASSASAASISATTAQTWAEGTDSAVSALGGTHSAKGWVNLMSPHFVAIEGVYADAENVDKVAASLTNVNTVAGSIAVVTSVANDLTAIGAVNDNKTNIDTVSADITNVRAVGENIANVNAVASDLTNVDAVVANATNIDAIASNATNINAVNANKTNIDAVAGSLANVNTVAADIADVSAVAGVAADVSAVAGIASDVTAVAGNGTDVSAVAEDITSVVAVAGNLSNIGAVAGNATKINAVAENAANINAIASDLTNINAVAADLTNIDAASGYAADSKKWAIGEPAEPVGGSAKYWAGQAASGQVNSDWSETDTTSKAYILNKPTLATVATSGSYNDLLNLPSYIPTTGGPVEYLQFGAVVMNGDPEMLHLKVRPNGKDPVTDNVPGVFLPLEDAPSGQWTRIITEYTKSSIQWPVGVIHSNDTDTLKELFVGSDGGGKFGAFLSLHRADCPNAAGAFGLFTRNADGGIGPALFATNDGGLTWNGKTVVCVESWVNGVNWYRKYSDGWIEQGGYHPSTGNWNDYAEGLNTSFNTPFVNAKNNVQITMVSKGDLANPTNVTTTKFTLWIGDRLQGTSVTDEFYWYACGY